MLLKNPARLAIGDVFLETTLRNLNASDGKIAISVYDAESLEGYQIKGTAEYLTEGEIVSAFKVMVEKMFNGAATAKGALLITPEKVIVTTPGADNKKVLYPPCKSNRGKTGAQMSAHPFFDEKSNGKNSIEAVNRLDFHV
ncbi:MAG: pyridoxamine 5'-phosphate oxidase family protein [Oscillospiraceae bacterium]|nr:pyridoxamine 5'-phosphate oxidase family protein [Oscillospiraceae bacterium]